MIGHQHQLDVLGLRQDVSLLLQMEQGEVRGPIHPLRAKCEICSGMVSHPVRVWGVVDGGDRGVRYPAAPNADTLQWTGGEQQVESIVRLCVSSSAPSTGSALLVLLLVEVLRLKLKAEGGVYDDDAAGEGTHQVRLVSFVSE